MVELPVLDGEVRIDFCPESGGIWLDKGERDKLPIMKSKIDIDRGVLKNKDTVIPSVVSSAVSSALLPLPNLAFSSGMILFGMYALLTLLLIIIVELTGLAPAWALMIGIGVALFHFLLGPFLMDLSLRFLYRIKWVQPSELPQHLEKFISDVCRKKNINFPRMGIILDGSPNAFTYGHHPNNARIVLTQGLLDLLTEEEVETVTAHEIGHVVHWDMLVMTLAQLVPLILYYIYRTLIEMRSRGKEDKSAAARLVIAMAAYILYIISEYIVLWFSRIREYYADRFSGEITNRPSRLASALVKIGYGLAGDDSLGNKAKAEKRTGALAAIGPLGIFDGRTANILAISGYSSPAQKMEGEINKETLKDAAKWDLWNPWATYYELHSTHPLIAKRLKFLGNQARALGQEPFVEFNERKPESYWDDFLVDIGVKFLPLAVILGTMIFFIMRPAILWIGIGLFLFGFSLRLNILYTYPHYDFAFLNIKALLKKIKVSAVRPVPCRVKGRIIGRGVPGLIFSEDFVMQDDTGIIFLDYQQPLGIFNFLFGLLRAKDYVDKEAEITGWYRRSPVPYIEIKKLKVNERESTCFVYHLKVFASMLFLAGGLMLSLLSILK